MLLSDHRVRPGALKVVTRQRFFGPYVIKQIIQGGPDIGPAYQLLDEKTGRVLSNLVTSDRLKRYNVNRDEFSKRLPRLNAVNTEGKTLQSVPKQTIVGQTKVKSDNGRSHEPKPVEIIKEMKVRGRKQYLVRYDDNNEYACDWVNKPLLDHFRTQTQHKKAAGSHKRKY